MFCLWIEKDFQYMGLFTLPYTSSTLGWLYEGVLSNQTHNQTNHALGVYIKCMGSWF